MSLMRSDAPPIDVAAANMIAPLSVGGPIDATQLVGIFLEGRAASTTAAYARDLEDFAAFIGASGSSEAVRHLLAGTHGAANALALQYRNALFARGLASASINRRLSSLRAVVALGRRLGLVTWPLEIANVRSRAYRDTAGPGNGGMRRLLAVAAAQSDPRMAARDLLLCRLLHDIGLRRGEMCALDLDDYDPATRRLMVLGKGRTEKEPVTLPMTTNAALLAWLARRGDAPGPLLHSFDTSSIARQSG